MVYFRVLGPLSVERDGVILSALAAPMLRRLVGALICRAGQPVSAEELTTALWGETAPPKARKTLQVYVRRLRLAIDEDRVALDAAGYRFHLGPDELDAAQFERRVAAARAERGTRAAELFAAALSLWNGAAYEDVRDHPPIADEARRLDEERLRAEAEYAALCLELGRHEELVPRLRTLTAAHPFREDLSAHLMLALYRTGRQAEALEVFRDTRRLLRNELGVEPGRAMRFLHEAILRSSPELDLNAMTPRELPTPIAGFVGRRHELKALDAMLPGSSSMMIVVIAGTAGVGKTALAVHWAHRVADRFPDGQLYLNLNGFAPSAPVRAMDALASMLRSIGVPPEKVPVKEAEAAALFRTRMAARRMLVLLDNAGSAEQVRPLLPGGSGSLVLVTSRNNLSGLVAGEGASRLGLDVLSPQESRELLDRVLGTRKTAAEPDAAAELARICAHLPLALRVAAANLNDRPHRSVRDHVLALLSNDRLDALVVEGDREIAVRAAFEQSYLDVPADVRRTFRLLGLIPGADFSVDAVAALTGMPVGRAESHLMRLTAAHLINQTGSDRFTFHDLLRIYAAGCATEDEDDQERAAAMLRFYAWCEQRVNRAAKILYPTLTRLAAPPPEDRESFGSPDKAIRWLDAERSNLVAAIEHAAEHGPHEAAWILADALRGYFARRKYVTDWLTTASMALDAAMKANDQRAQASAHITFAHACRSRHLYADARHHLEQAAELIKGTDWQIGLAAVTINLGGVIFETGTMREAAAKVREALRLSRQIGYIGGQALATANLGLILGYAGRLSKAVELLGESIALNKEIGGLQVESAGYTDLGTMLYQLGRLHEAQDALIAAVQKKLVIGDRLGEALARAELANVHCELGQLEAAEREVDGALTLAGDLGDHQARSSALIASGTLLLAKDEISAAIGRYRLAIRIAREVGINYPETVATLGLALAYRRSGDSDAALENTHLAIRLARSAGFGVREGQALTMLAAVYLDRGARGEATKAAQRALRIHRRTGHARGIADTLAILQSVRASVD